MAKKKANNDFNMSAEIRNLLKANRTMGGTEVYNALVKNFPKQNINKNSCSVAVYKIRTTKAAKKKSGVKKVVRVKRPSSAGTAVDINSLQAAAKFVAQIGSTDEAVAAIKQLESVQIR